MAKGTPIGFKIAGALHRTAYRLGLGRKMMGVPVLILRTTGRRSGNQIETALTYFEDSEGKFVIASKGGAPADPAWYLNLVAQPEVSVQIGNEVSKQRATVVTDPTERNRLYAIAVKAMPGYAGYEKKTDRKIPVVRLAPVS